jgi:hypothetical protein
MVLKELQHALRTLSRAPRFSLACTFTLALAEACPRKSGQSSVTLVESYRC